MKSFLNRKIVIGATTLALLGGAGGAVAATQTSGRTSRQAYVNDLAKHLGVSPSALSTAMKAAAIDRVNAAQAAGRLTQAQANRRKQRIEQGRGVGLFGHRARGGLRFALNAASKYLGISKATLRRDLRSGKSLAKVAFSTPGKSTSGLKAAILTADKTRLDRAVASGRITRTQEQKRLATVSSRIDSLLARTH